jgi:hypothetical protein
LVVFGSAPTRARALARLPTYVAALRRLGIERVVEVGSGSEAGRAASAEAGFDFDFAGTLDTPVVSQMLCTASYGLIDYPGVFLAKSGVFAAYAAHGCVVLNTAPVPGPADGLEAGTHLVDLNADTALPIDICSQQRMREALHRWYADHRIEVQAHELLPAPRASPSRRGHHA